MNIIIKIINRVFVLEYYKANLFFFLMILSLLTGFGTFPKPILLHSEIMLDISKHAYLLMITLFLFTLYNFKCYHFIIKQFTATQNNFLMSLIHLPKKRLFSYLLYIQIVLLLPFLIYLFITASIAFINAHFLSGIFTLIYSLLLASATAFCYGYRVWMHTNKEYTVIPLAWTRRIKKAPFLFYVLFVLQEQEVCLVITKICSGIVLVGVINAGDAPDIKFIAFGILTSIFIHTTLIFRVKSFEDQFMDFLRILPLPTYNRIASLLLAYSFILIPEILVIFFNFIQSPETFAAILFVIPLALSTILFFHSILYTLNVDINNYITYSFCIYLLITLIVLFGIHPLILGFVFFFISYFLFHRYYYAYETKSNLIKRQ
ncbi:MAG: hypothetical protein ABI315_08760 [Bacteroidia bacterium]